MSTHRIRAAAISEVDKALARARQTVDDIHAAMDAMNALENEHPDIAGRVLSFNTSPRINMGLRVDDFLTLAEDAGGIGCASFEVLGQFCVGSIRWRGAEFRAVGEAHLWSLHGVQVETETTVRVSMLT